MVLKGDLRGVITQYNKQMMYSIIVHLKPTSFLNQFHHNNFNKKVKKQYATPKYATLA